MYLYPTNVFMYHYRVCFVSVGQWWPSVYRTAPLKGLGSARQGWFVIGTGSGRWARVNTTLYPVYMLGRWVNPHREQQTIPQGHTSSGLTRPCGIVCCSLCGLTHRVNPNPRWKETDGQVCPHGYSRRPREADSSFSSPASSHRRSQIEWVAAVRAQLTRTTPWTRYWFDVCVHIYIYIYIYVYIYINMYICISIFIYMYVCVCVYTHTHTHTHTHTYIYIIGTGSGRWGSACACLARACPWPAWPAAPPARGPGAPEDTHTRFELAFTRYCHH